MHITSGKLDVSKMHRLGYFSTGDWGTLSPRVLFFFAAFLGFAADFFFAIAEGRRGGPVAWSERRLMKRAATAPFGARALRHCAAPAPSFPAAGAPDSAQPHARFFPGAESSCRCARGRGHADGGMGEPSHRSARGVGRCAASDHFLGDRGRPRARDNPEQKKVATPATRPRQSPVSPWPPASSSPPSSQGSAHTRAAGGRGRGRSRRREGGGWCCARSGGCGWQMKINFASANEN